MYMANKEHNTVIDVEASPQVKFDGSYTGRVYTRISLQVRKDRSSRPGAAGRVISDNKFTNYSFRSHCTRYVHVHSHNYSSM